MSSEEPINEWAAFDRLLNKYSIKYNSYMGTVGPGWFPLLESLISDLIAMGWNKEVSQIKEKFGALRFYAFGGSEEIWKRIEEAEAMSEKICEVCGQPGTLDSDLGWWLTLCPEHNRLQRERTGR